MIINQTFNKVTNEHSNNDLGLFRKATNKKDVSFTNYLTDAISKVNDLEKTSDAYKTKLASGDLENIHEAMIASQKAEVSLLFMMEIRNKVLDAYREIMRMQI